MRAVLAHEFEGERDRLGRSARIERGDTVHQARDNSGVMAYRLHRRQATLFDVPFKAFDDGFDLETRQRPDLPAEGAVLGHDVLRPATLNQPDLQGRVARREPVVLRSVAQLIFDAAQLRNQHTADMNGVNPDMRHAGMGLAARDGGAETGCALVAVNNGHVGGFADNDQPGPCQPRSHLVNHRAHTGAPHLLIIGEHDMDGRLQVPRFVLWHHRECASQEPLHIASATPIEHAVALGDFEWIARPLLAFHWHHIGMAREADARLACLANRCEQAGLEAVRRWHKLALDTMASQIAAHELNQRNVGLGAGRIESDQLFEEIAGSLSSVGQDGLRFGGHSQLQASVTDLQCAR